MAGDPMRAAKAASGRAAMHASAAMNVSDAIRGRMGMQGSAGMRMRAASSPQTHVLRRAAYCNTRPAKGRKSNTRPAKGDAKRGLARTQGGHSALHMADRGRSQAPVQPASPKRRQPKGDANRWLATN